MRVLTDRTAFAIVTLVAGLLLGTAIGATLPWISAAVIAMVCLALLVLRWPVAGLLAVIGTLVAGQLVRLGFSDGGGALLLSDLLLPVALAVWACVRVAANERIRIGSSLWAPIGTWIAVMGFSLLLGIPRLNPDGADARTAVLYALRWVLYLGAFVLTLDLVRSARVARLVLGSLLGAALLVAALGFVQLAVLPDFSSFVPQGWDPHVGRLLSTWFDPNFVGGFFAFVLLVTVGIAWEHRGTARLVLLGAAGVQLLALLLTYSRSAYLGLAVGGLVFAILRARWLLLAGAFVGLLVFVSVPRVQERVIGIRSVDETAQLRIVSWNNALEVVRDHPLTGIGYNAYRAAQVRYGFLTDTAEHSAGGSDSSLLTIAVTTGIPGLGVYLWLLVAQFRAAAADRAARGLRRGLACGATAGLAALVVHGQFINGLLFPHLLLTVWVVLGTQGALRREERA